LARNGPIAALDIGTTKTCCFIAEANAVGAIRVSGIGHYASRGIKSGAIVDMEAAEQSVLSAVHAAEQMAGTTIRDVAVNVASGKPASQTLELDTDLGGAAIGEREVRRLLDDDRIAGTPPDRHLIHAVPLGFAIDGSNGIRDPQGLHGQTLGVRVHTVTAAAGAVRNLATCVERCHLDIGDFVINAYAAGLSCLVEDELDLGVTVIDMGGGVTSIAVFYEGALVWSDSVPIGGRHITGDIARGLSTPVAHAERLKTLHGSCLPSPTDEQEMISAPRVGETDESQVNSLPKSFLVSIIGPRVEETFELVRERLDSTRLAGLGGRRVVLTGGASQLPGVRELAGQILDKQARMGRPTQLSGLAEATCGPAFATCAGLLAFAVDDRGEARPRPVRDSEPTDGMINRLGGWFRENF
jgi:cell division protein FtsA